MRLIEFVAQALTRLAEQLGSLLMALLGCPLKIVSRHNPVERHADAVVVAIAHSVLRLHVAIKGDLSSEWHYRAMGSWRKSHGSMVQPVEPAVTATSLMLETTYQPARVAGLECRAQLALDRGDLYGNNLGGLITVSYHGNLTLGKR